MVPGWQGSVNLRECSPWFLNADPPDFSAKELERSSFFASIRNKWWDGLVQCATVQICNKSRKFANIEFFSPRVSRTHCQEAQQHRKRRFWQVSRFLTDFEKLQEFSNGDWCGLSDDGGVSLGNAEPWLTFNFPQIHFVCFLSSGSSLRGVFFITKQLVFSFLVPSLFSEPIFSFLVFKLEWLSNHPLKVKRALLLRLLIQLLDFLAK